MKHFPGTGSGFAGATSPVHLPRAVDLCVY